MNLNLIEQQEHLFQGKEQNLDKLSLRSPADVDTDMWSDPNSVSVCAPDSELPTTTATTPTDTGSQPNGLLDPNEHDTLSVVSNQSYSTALDYEEELLFENDNNDHNRSLEGSADDRLNNSNYWQTSNSGIADASREPGNFGNLWTDSVDQQQLINMEPTALLQQQMTILHPALSVTPIPSTLAPTVYALASAVAHPTVNQLSINLPNQPITQEPVAVPFKTILCHPPNAVSGNEMPPSLVLSQETQQQNVQQQPSEGVAGRGDGNTSDHSLETSGKDDVHPYFAACDIPERVSSRRHNRTQDGPPAKPPSLEINVNGSGSTSLVIVSPTFV